MTEVEQFSVGPPAPVTDSRKLPVISSEEEDAFVTGADLGSEHPDNGEDVPDSVLDDVLVAATAEDQAAAEAAAGDPNVPDASDDELDDLTKNVNTDDLDMSGFGIEELGFVGLDSRDHPQLDQDGGS